MNTAILFDTMSIQHYVFGSNKLRDNVGASYIIEHIYDHLIEKSNQTPGELDIGYIGGGKALVFTNTENKAKEIIKDYTTKLLYLYPGVSLSVAIQDGFGKEDSEYERKLRELFNLLEECKGLYMQVNTIPSHGITDICRVSSLSVENIITYHEKGKTSYECISSMTASKRKVDEKVKTEEENILSSVRITGYHFPLQLDKLGQDKGSDSHIAIVHIDGNGFGKEFRSLKDNHEVEALSKKVKNVVKTSFEHILKEYMRYKVDLEKIIIPDFDDERKDLLPIRPVILGGDDITFVCNGKLGIWFAEKFMKHFNSFYIDDKQTRPFSSCAGVAIVKTKYPFFRAYQLAEELCNNAKKKRKDNGQSGNWIDFHLAYGGLGNSLEEIRHLQYRTINNEPLYSRPYSIEGQTGGISMESLKKQTSLLKESLPSSKIKDLREVLTQDQISQEVFIEHLKHQHEKFKKNFCEQITPKQLLKKYPLFDMIELLELYPADLLNIDKNATKDI